MLKPRTSFTVLFRLFYQTVVASSDPVWYYSMLNHFHELMVLYENLALSIVNKPPAICLITSNSSFPVPRKPMDKKEGSINRTTDCHTTIHAVYLLWSSEYIFLLSHTKVVCKSDVGIISNNLLNR